MDAFKEIWKGKYILLWTDGSPVGLDEHSGGYPFKVLFDPSSVRYFPNRKKAEEYRDKFPECGFSLHEISYISMFAEKYSS